MNCETCGELVTGRGAYCCRKCMPSRHKLIKISCPKCGKIRERRGYLSQARSKVLCLECTSDQFNGEGNPNWKGGHKHWSPGRFGKDKDGLSWKVQRQLAWERDDYTCQHCHEKKNRNPDVHHITPFRVSQSHALDNLICLCQSCHLKLEATVQDEWGGQAPPTHQTCQCGKRCRNEQCGECKKKKKLQSSNHRSCDGPYSKKAEEARKVRVSEKIKQKEDVFPLVLEMRNQGFSLAQIAKKLPIKLHRQTIYNWLKWGSPHKR